MYQDDIIGSFVSILEQKIKEIEESNIKNKNRITSEANTLLKVLKSEIKKKEKEKNKVDFMIGGNTSNYEYGYAYN